MVLLDGMSFFCLGQSYYVSIFIELVYGLYKAVAHRLYCVVHLAEF